MQNDIQPPLSSSISLLLTGGTIDKTYNESNGELGFVDTHIPEMLELGRNLSAIDIVPVMLKDSLQMDDNDRQQIADACSDVQSNKIVITHGTDTMVETAKVLAQLNLQKTIVLVGAMVPFVFKHSDAMFNMGFALGAVHTLPLGIYIAMNGQILEWDNVVKNKEKGRFEPLP